MPVEQEREAVRGEVGGVGREHLGSVAGVERVLTIPRHHIEERPCEVTLVIIVGFVHRTDISCRGCTEFAKTVVVRVFREATERAYHTVWIVRTEVWILTVLLRTCRSKA